MRHRGDFMSLWRLFLWSGADLWGEKRLNQRLLSDVVSDLRQSGISPLSPVQTGVWATKWGHNCKVMFVVRRRKASVLMNRPWDKKLAFEAWCWQLWGVWNGKPCQSIPHSASAVMTRSGRSLLLYFPFKKTFFLNVLSEPGARGVLCPFQGHFRAEALLAFQMLL